MVCTLRSGLEVEVGKSGNLKFESICVSAEGEIKVFLSKGYAVSC